MPKLFISYRRKSSDFMYRVAERLTSLLDADVFYDFAGIDNNNFELSLMRNLRECDVMLLIVTEHTFDPLRIYDEDDWVRREVAEALRLEKPIVLALYEGLTPPPDLPDDIRDIRKKHGLSFYREPWLFEPCIGALVDFMCRSTVLQRKIATQTYTRQPIELSDSQLHRQQFIEALDALEELPEKALFMFEALRDAGYKPNSRGVNLEMLIHDAREAAQTQQTRKDALLEYQDIHELVKRPATRKHGLLSLAEWQKTYPALATELDHDDLLSLLNHNTTIQPVVPSKEKKSTPLTHIQPILEETKPTLPVEDKPAHHFLTPAYEFHKIGQRNADWKPVITTFPDAPIAQLPFCLVPTGAFQMGTEELSAFERPVHTQNFDQPFYIAQYPVTNRDWEQGVIAGIVKEPQGRRAHAWYKDPQMANAPVIGMTWYEAQRFAAWMGCRLPTEREWEYAARGIESFIYPWGNKWDVTKPVWEGNSGGYPNDVTTRQTNVSWVGAAHLSGNVWEWCASFHGVYPYPATGIRERLLEYKPDTRYVLRGGSWNDGAKEMRSAYRSDYSPVSGSLIIGFRLARSVEN